MPATVQWILILSCLVLIAVLLWVIRSQWQRLQVAKRSQAKTQALQERRRDSMIESIRLLAMTVEQDQIEYSEACLRIKGLLDHVAPELLLEEPYTVFQVVYEKIEHMPTHEARKQADPAWIRKLDEDRFALERKYAQEIRAAAIAIRQYDFSRKAAKAGEPQQVTPVKSTLQ